MEEVIFIVEESLDRGYTANGLSFSINTQAENPSLLKDAVIGVVHCHFDDVTKRIARLHIVKEEVIEA
jgi:hypothetical protein